MKRLRLRRPSPAMLVAVLALFVATGAPVHAASAINGALLKNRSVSGIKLELGAVSNSRLAVNSVTASKVKNGSMLVTDLSPSAVAALVAVPPNGVATGQILDNTINTSDIANNSIDSGEIRNGSLDLDDVAEASGTITLDLDAVPANSCQFKEVDNADLNRQGANLTNDLIMITPPSSWPVFASISAKPTTNDPNKFVIIYCAHAAGVDPLSGTYTYAAFNP